MRKSFFLNITYTLILTLYWRKWNTTKFMNWASHLRTDAKENCFSWLWFILGACCHFDPLPLPLVKDRKHGEKATSALIQIARRSHPSNLSWRWISLWCFSVVGVNRKLAFTGEAVDWCNWFFLYRKCHSFMYNCIIERGKIGRFEQDVLINYGFLFCLWALSCKDCSLLFEYLEII